MKGLGHVLSSAANYDDDFNETVRHVWGAWHANVNEGLFKLLFVTEPDL